MRGVFGLVLLIGMGLAGFAVYMVNQYMDTQSAALQRERERASNVVQTIDIYAPSRDLTYGERLTIDDVKIIKYAVDNLPDGYFQTEEGLFPEGVNVPRVVRIPMRINEPILISKVTEAGAAQGITALLDPGMRAFPLPDELTRSFSGELRNSDVIDLYWSGRVGDGQQISRLVKSRLEIISIDQGGNGVVVQVSQEDFADLQVLQSAGSLSLTPIGRNDDEIGTETIETNIQDVLGIEAVVVEEEPEVVEERICTRRERRGVDIVTLQVPCED